MFDVELVDPNKDKCTECGCGLGIHLVTCSHFYRCDECRTHCKEHHYRGCSKAVQQ